MDYSSLQELLREGIAAAKLAQQKPASADLDHRERARELLIRVTEFDEQNIPAWLWLSTVADTTEEKQTCLENVLVLDPTNKHALAGLARLQQTVPSQPPPEPEPPPAPPPARSKYTRLKPKAAGQAQPAPAQNPALARPVQQRTGLACPFCEQPISAIDKVCPHCTLPLVMGCPDCGADIDVEQDSCSECGGAMGDYRDPLAYFARLGAAYRAGQQYEAGIKAWQAVETLQPDYPQLHVRLSEAHLGVGRPDRAWASLKQALKETPDAAEVHFAMGELTRQRGERDEAFKHYQAAVQRDPKYGLAWFQLGQIYRQARLQKEATQAYRQAIKFLAAGSLERRQAEEQLERLTPSLPENMATGWPELLRQMTGPVILCVLAALLDSGLRPWWIPLSGWFALLLAVTGTFMSVSGGLPRNPLMRLLAGERGLVSSESKITIAIVGAILWLLALLLILLPLGQSYPELPQL